MQAKTEAAKEGKWLLVNVQSTTEFASYTVSLILVITYVKNCQPEINYRFCSFIDFLL